MDKLQWYKDNEKHYTGFDDGTPWAWVFKGEDESWWWSTDCTDDGITKEVSGFETADDAKSAADAAYGEWVESLGDPMEGMESIDMDFIQTLGKHCDLYGYCPHGCKVGDEQCKYCHDYTETDILSVFDVPEDEG